MGITIFSNEHISPIPPARIFKASIVNSHNLIPKLMPQAIKSIEIIQGNGGAGSIKQINFAQEKSVQQCVQMGNEILAGSFSSLEHRIDELDETTYTYSYTLMEGDALIDKLEKISYEVKFEPTPEGGSIAKVTSKYHTEGDFLLKEEDIKGGKERVLAMYKVVEVYLLENPDAYV